LTAEVEEEKDQVYEAIRTLLTHKEGERYCLKEKFSVSEVSTA